MGGRKPLQYVLLIDANRPEKKDQVLKTYVYRMAFKTLIMSYG